MQTIKLNLGDHTYTFPEGLEGQDWLDGDTTFHIVRMSLESGTFPLRAIQGAFDLYGITGVSREDGELSGSLNSHSLSQSLESGYMIEYGDFSMVFPRKIHIAIALDRPVGSGSYLVERGGAITRGRFKGLTGRKL